MCRDLNLINAIEKQKFRINLPSLEQKHIQQKVQITINIPNTVRTNTTSFLLT